MLFRCENKGKQSQETEKDKFLVAESEPWVGSHEPVPGLGFIISLTNKILKLPVI